MKRILLAIALTACAPIDVEPASDVDVDGVEQEVWEACYPYVKMKTALDPHYFWNWGTNSLNFIPDPDLLWRSGGAVTQAHVWQLTYQDNSGICQYSSLSPLSVVRDVPNTWNCAPSDIGPTWAFFCPDNQWYYCPVNLGVPRPEQKGNSASSGSIPGSIDFEYGYSAVKSWDITPIAKPANAYLGAPYQNGTTRPLICSYYPSNPTFTMDRW